MARTEGTNHGAALAEQPGISRPHLHKRIERDTAHDEWDGADGEDEPDMIDSEEVDDGEPGDEDTGAQDVIE